MGLKQFVIDEADISIVKFTFKLKINIPTNLTLTGDYVSYGNGLLPITGHGPFR